MDMLTTRELTMIRPPMSHEEAESRLQAAADQVVAESGDQVIGSGTQIAETAVEAVGIVDGPYRLLNVVNGLAAAKQRLLRGEI